MLQWIRWILVVYLLLLIGILIAIKPFWLSSCQRAIVIHYVDDSETILDYRTYLTIQRDATSSNQAQSNMPYQIEYDFSTGGTRVYVRSRLDNETRLLYSATYFAAAYLSADLNSFYVYELRTTGENQGPVRLVRMDFASGDLIQDYGNEAAMQGASPERDTIYAFMLNPEKDDWEMAAIDSNTGNVTYFNRPYHHIGEWSPDYRWMSISRGYGFEIVDYQTGENHPLLNQLFSGSIEDWTENGIWIRENTGNSYDVLLASLDDGTVSLQYENLVGLLRSKDDRWRAISRRIDGKASIQVHDSLTDQYSDIDVSRPMYFSDDGRCLLAGRIVDGNPQETEFVIYDLRTMSPIRTHYRAGVLDYSLYEED